jgi:hypothetical protein
MSTLQWEWQEHYRDALLETNPLNLGRRVATAERAIFLRTKELRDSLAGQVERQAIADAINGLSVLKREIQVKVRAGASYGTIRGVA